MAVYCLVCGHSVKPNIESGLRGDEFYTYKEKKNEIWDLNIIFCLY